MYVPPGIYPFRALAYLATRPSLGRRVGLFLAALCAVSALGILALAFTTFGYQLRLVGQTFLGRGILGKVFTCFLILAEASVPVYLAFQQSMQALQKRLFLDVLHGKFTHSFKLFHSFAISLVAGKLDIALSKSI